MNTQPSTALKVPLAGQAASGTGSFYQRLVLQSLAGMTRGCLRLELPDGSRRVYGQPGAPISAQARIVRPEFFQRCVLYGDVGFGEAYVEGDWETDDITSVIAWFIINIDNAPGLSGSKVKQWAVNVLGWQNQLRHWWRPNSLGTSRRNIAEHYDLGNDFYRLFLDPTMTYSAGLFETHHQTLEQAQVAKYDRLCRQLKLQPGDTVLEIGGGWGGFSRHAAKIYGARITSVTISEEQFKYARDLMQREGLTGQVEVQLVDYRKVTGQFDKIVSIEMIEAVGDAYLETYFAKCQELLKPDGLLALQMITCPDSRHDELRRGVDWIQKHIFPGSLLVSI